MPSAIKKMLSMVMDNFLSNAVRFCIPGGVIRLSVARNYVSVYNEGIQIPEERKKRNLDADVSYR